MRFLNFFKNREKEPWINATVSKLNLPEQKGAEEKNDETLDPVLSRYWDLIQQLKRIQYEKNFEWTVSFALAVLGMHFELPEFFSEMLACIGVWVGSAIVTKSPAEFFPETRESVWNIDRAAEIATDAKKPKPIITGSNVYGSESFLEMLKKEVKHISDCVKTITGYSPEEYQDYGDYRRVVYTLMMIVLKFISEFFPLDNHLIERWLSKTLINPASRTLFSYKVSSALCDQKTVEEMELFQHNR